jgi:hypothetical protein
MVILGTYRGKSLTLSIKPNCLTLSLGGEQGSDVYSYDYTGRLWTAMVAGISYRRGLNGKTVAKWADENGQRERRWLSAAEATVLEEQARLTAHNLLHAVDSDQVTLSNPLDDLGRSGLLRASNMKHEHYRQDIIQYHQVYKPVRILPPDQYMAVVLQATEGCSFNTCTFCDFYRDRPFRIKKPQEFNSHCEAVRDYLGEGLKLRRTIFLGDANALVVPMNSLLPLMDTVHQVYDVEALGGIYAFLDGFSGERKSSADFAELVRRGLKRVYIGMESGNLELLQFLKKPGKPGDVLHAVRTMKAGGVDVGIIVLLGAGGHAYSSQHIEDTVEMINQMNLDLNDIIYFSELIESENLTYVKDAYQTALKPLTSAERILQADTIEQRLSFSEAGGTPHISRYDIREFVY